MTQPIDIQLTDEEKQVLSSMQNIQKYKKTHILMHQGDSVDRYFSVITGCVRAYSLINDEEITLEFYTEGETVSPAVISKQMHSLCFIVCEEDCTISVVDQALEDAAFIRFPRIKALCAQVTEQLLIQQQADQLLWKSSNLESRYLHLLESRPTLFERVPHYQLASYLGVKPESLSRLRKRLGNNGVSYI